LLLLVEYSPNIPVTAPVKTINCTQGFYQEKGSSVCIPSCHNWTKFEPNTSKAIDGIVLSSILVGLFAAITVIVFSVIRWKKM